MDVFLGVGKYFGEILQKFEMVGQPVQPNAENSKVLEASHKEFWNIAVNYSSLKKKKMET